MKATSEATSAVTDVVVPLNPGWNAVGLQSQQVTALSSNPAVAGIAQWSGPAGYTSGNFSAADFNAGLGGRNGFWVFANAATSFTYSGNDVGPAFVELPFNGANLVSFCTSVDVAGSSLTATQNGQSVPLNSVVLPQFTEIGADNQYSTVDVLAGGVLKPGRAYWVTANTSNGAVRLNLPSASPSPAASPPLAAVALELTPVNTTVKLYQTIQFTLTARLADGKSQNVTDLAQWTSQDPSVAALLSPGLFKGLNSFPTSIKATLNGLSAETNLFVEPAIGTPGGPVQPATTNFFTGTFPPGQVRSQCPNIAGPALAQQTSFTGYTGGGPYNYAMYPFTVAVSGVYTAEATTTTSVHTGFFLRNRFLPDPVAPATPLSDFFLACLSNTGSPRRSEYLNMNLVAGQQYTYVLFYNTTAVSGEVHTFNIAGPGGVGIITN